MSAPVTVCHPQCFTRLFECVGRLALLKKQIQESEQNLKDLKQVRCCLHTFILSHERLDGIHGQWQDLI